MTTLGRRDLLRAAVALPLAAAAPAVAAGLAKAPNIVFILADDLGYADVSCYGRPDYRTPNIDALAEQGLSFHQAYANSAVCSATRVGLITGRYQNRLPVGLEEPLGLRDVGLPPSHPTLPSLLRKAGYATALVGKWHMGSLPKYGPLLSGYDHFWGFRGGGLDYFRHDAPTADLWDDDRRDPERGYITDLLGEHAVGMIDRFAQDHRPFFLSLHFSAPHWPWEGPDDEAESRRLAAEGPGGLLDFDGGSRRIFAAMVTRMDLQIGRVLQALAAHGLERDTIVVFTSDNGGERFSDTGPFLGRKTELLEGGLRIPAIIRWPGSVASGSSSDQVMISMDWLPTLLAAGGGAPDPAYPPDGMSLTGALHGAAPVPRTLFWRYLNLDQEACRDGDFKYLKILDNTFLFNVVEDPQERANLKGRQPDLYRQILAKYRAWNASMLPLDPKAATWGFSGAQAADHFGVRASRTVDD
jgi:arylsulfatase A-like enzyme